jgi:predicted  nucleic acid-binding Zn-ribbon protein
MIEFELMQQDLVLALRLQAIDRKTASLETEIAALPKHIAEVEKKLDAHTRRLEADRAGLAANLRDRKKLEGDIQAHQQKISKLRDQTLAAKNNEQYKAFQNEIAYAEAEIRKCEDRILTLMESAEALDSAVKAADSTLKTHQKQVESEKARAKARSADDMKEVAVQLAQRKAIIEQMTPDFHKEYERLRKKTKNRPIADATEGRCDLCQMSLRPQFFQDLRRGDKIMFCESCGRILTYNPVIDVVGDVSASKQIA